ncbi:nuclease-related domain-containing protein [Macrococcus capreoli]|uniref:nuclease-related domain-containing protein n=1 Tax=Macrococcus capreoli TaxID=2982690 RepID=UPI003EE4BB83
MLRPPRMMMLEDALKKRLEGYVYSEDYFFVRYGFLGEKEFVETFPIMSHHIELFNVVLKYYGTSFEVDRLVITGETIYAFDIKNHSGQYCVDGETWTKNQKNIKSPTTQFDVLEKGMRQIIGSTDIPHRLVCKMIFINKTFTINKNIHGLVTYYEIHPMMQRIRNELPSGKYEHRIKNYFVNLSVPNTLNKQRPQFDIKQLNGGVTCLKCEGKIDMERGNSPTICPSCGSKLKKDKLILQALIEYEILKDRGFTMKEAHSWIGRDFRNITKRVIDKHYSFKDGYYTLNDR